MRSCLQSYSAIAGLLIRLSDAAGAARRGPRPLRVDLRHIHDQPFDKSVLLIAIDTKGIIYEIDEKG
jgi:hypothetical protein